MDKIDIRDLIVRELKKEEIQVDNYNDAVFKHDYVKVAESIVENLPIYVVSFELPSDDIFDMQEVDLKNPLEEFYYYERPAYLENDQKQFRERLQKALNYLKGN